MAMDETLTHYNANWTHQIKKQQTTEMISTLRKTLKRTCKSRVLNGRHASNLEMPDACGGVWHILTQESVQQHERYLTHIDHYARTRGATRSTQQESNKTGNVHITWHWGTFANHWSRGKLKALYISVCVRACRWPGAWACECACARVALLIQHATRMRHTETSVVVPLAPSRFSTVSHKRHDFRNNVTEHKMCILTSSTTCV
jgi:hypothetical protein